MPPINSNIENEKFEKLMIKVQSAMAIAQGVGGLKDLIEGFGTLKTVFGTATTACSTFIKGLNGVKLAIASTGIGLLVVAISTLVTYWDDLTESVKKWTGAVEEGNSSFDKLLTKQGYLSNEALKKQKELNREIKIMQAEEKGDIEINENDLRIDTYRSSGAGGQHVNKTDSAVRITHLPTGIVVSCQNQRSQIQNREKAMQVLKSRLYQKEHELQEQKKRQAAGEQMENGWGSQIRSYILHPYALVKDHRTNLESSQPQAVLDGEINEFLITYLQWLKNGDNNE
jgi:hypothetical protein